ncbi:hypothetical protein [Chitinasiproducens palmae]|uniref:Phage tail assembly protein n=1 Tax=Chitinasiproducens palmae TaxID=1770053 RepID=A0A1H2PWE0_9BURK|nr:hypothetical protein [Chitinasiproducens palmae]SDV51682.1 hypothetical protein SAMN05216551_1226 [Chitinasiproducens palmae]
MPAYVIKKNPIYTHPVDVPVHSEATDGTGTTQRLVATFRYKSRNEVEQLEKSKPLDVLDAVLVSVAGVVDENGAELPANDETKAAVLQDPLAFLALVRAFWQSLAEVAVKN